MKSLENYTVQIGKNNFFVHIFVFLNPLDIREVSSVMAKAVQKLLLSCRVESLV